MSYGENHYKRKQKGSDLVRNLNLCREETVMSQFILFRDEWEYKMEISSVGKYLFINYMGRVQAHNSWSEQKHTR
jgi:hypothetical protein